MKAVSSIHNLRTGHAVMTRDPLNMVLIPIYSQLPSICGGCLLHPQLEDAPYRGCKDLNDTDAFDTTSLHNVGAIIICLIPASSLIVSIMGHHLGNSDDKCVEHRIIGRGYQGLFPCG
jgi:hypothetical protein